MQILREFRPGPFGRGIVFVLAAFSVLSFPGGAPSSLAAPRTDGPDAGEDKSKMFFELGVSNLLQDRRTAARSYFQRSERAEGEFSDEARVFLVRLAARAGSNPGQKRLPGIRAILRRIKNPEIQRKGWLASVQSLYSQGVFEEALAQAQEGTRRFPGTRTADALGIIAAEILMERRRDTAALEELFRVIGRDPGGKREFTDDAYYFTAKIYAAQGPLRDVRKALGALEAFFSFKTPVFLKSGWREPAMRLRNKLLRGE